MGPATPAKRRLGIALATAALGVAAIAGVVVGRLSVDGGAGVQAQGAEAAAYQRELRHRLVALASTRREELGALARAQTRSEQRAGLHALAELHRRAARSLARMRAPAHLRAPEGSLVRSLQDVAAGYRRLGDEAAAGATGFEAARKALGRAEARLRRQLRSIQEAAA